MNPQEKINILQNKGLQKNKYSWLQFAPILNIRAHEYKKLL